MVKPHCGRSHGPMGMAPVELPLPETRSRRARDVPQGSVQAPDMVDARALSLDDLRAIIAEKEISTPVEDPRLAIVHCHSRRTPVPGRHSHINTTTSRTKRAGTVSPLSVFTE